MRRICIRWSKDAYVISREYAAWHDYSRRARRENWNSSRWRVFLRSLCYVPPGERIRGICVNEFCPACLTLPTLTQDASFRGRSSRDDIYPETGCFDNGMFVTVFEEDVQRKTVKLRILSKIFSPPSFRSNSRHSLTLEECKSEGMQVLRINILCKFATTTVFSKLAGIFITEDTYAERRENRHKAS